MDKRGRATAERGISPLLLLITGLFLFLPFVSVSCNASNGTNVANASATGIQAMTGSDVQVQNPSGAASTVDAGIHQLGPFTQVSANSPTLIHINGQPLLTGALLLLIVALAFSATRIRSYRWLTAGFSAAAAVCLGIVQLVNNSQFLSDVGTTNSNASSAPSIFQLNWETGYWLMLAGTVFVALYNVSMAVLARADKADDFMAPPSEPPTVSLSGKRTTEVPVGASTARPR